MTATKNQKFIREEVYRGAEAIDRLSAFHVTIAGVGALGSNLAETLSRQGIEQIRLIDNDRVEEQNLGTQIYGTGDIGALKVEATKQILFRNVEVEVEAFNKEFRAQTAKRLLKNTDLVVDAFDNHAARKLITEYCLANQISCLHLGMLEGLSLIHI